MWMEFTSDRVDDWLSWVNVLMLIGGISLAILAVMQFKLTAMSDRFADERITSNETETARANEAAENAKAEAARANEGAALAHKKASEAEEKTAVALLKAKQLEEYSTQIRLELENEVDRQRGGFRTVDGERRTQLVKWLKHVPKLPVRVYRADMGDEESMHLAATIKWVLQEAGFEVSASDDTLVGRAMPGEMYLLVKSYDDMPAHWNGLQVAFGRIGWYKPALLEPAGNVKEGEVGIVIGVTAKITRP